MLVEIFKAISKMEEQIGNGVWVLVGVSGEQLIFTAQWPNNLSAREALDIDSLAVLNASDAFLIRRLIIKFDKLYKEGCKNVVAGL